MNDYYAHSGRDRMPARSDWQPLLEHPLAVAKLAGGHASEIQIRGASLGPAFPPGRRRRPGIATMFLASFTPHSSRVQPNSI